MKLELKNLAPYLPYSLKFYVDMFEFTEGNSKPEMRLLTMGNDVTMCLKYGKPILRPLSDLTKETLHNGEKVIPLIEIAKIISFYEIEKIESYSKSGDAVIYFIDSKGFKRGVDIFLSPEGYLQYNFYTRNEKWAEDWTSLRIDHLRVTNQLLEWHFDVFGLIDAGLAIDINTIEK